MRAAAVQLQSTPDRDRNLAAADRLTRAAAAAGRGARRAAREVARAGHAGADDRRRRAARRPGRCSGRARRRAASSASTSSRARSPSTSTGDARGAQHVAPRRPRRRAAGDLPQDPHVRRRGRRARLQGVRARGAGRRDRRLADRRRRRPRPDHLLRRPLPRALPDPRRPGRARSSPSPPRSRFATTRDHWEILLRARAIEGQAFVVAANQIGEHAPGIRSGGRSMIVDPWGVVLATAPDTETFVVAELDLERQAEIRRTLPSLANRRPRGVPLAHRGAGLVALQAGRRQAADHPRRRRARVRARGLPHLPRLGHRRRGGRRLRARLPLLQVQGPGARHAVPRALGRPAGRDPPHRRARRSRPTRSCTRSPASSSSPTVTIPT